MEIGLYSLDPDPKLAINENPEKVKANQELSAEIMNSLLPKLLCK